MGNSQDEGDLSLPPPLSLATRLKLACATFAINVCRRRDGTINRHLLSLLDPKLPARPSPGGITTVDVPVDGPLWLRLFFPSSPSPLPVVVYFHGGGFIFGSPASSGYHLLCRRLARHLPVAVVSVGYRLAPEHRCPAQYDDGLAVLGFLDGSGDPSLIPLLRLGDLSRCFLAGDSAGANIAHHVARLWAPAEARRVRLAGLVSLQPFFGGKERVRSETREMWATLVGTVETTDWMWRAFLPEGEGRDHWAANPRGDGAELGEGFPAACIVVIGGRDRLWDWQWRYVEWLREKGKKVVVREYPEAFHGFYCFPELEENAVFMEDLKAFVSAHST